MSKQPTAFPLRLDPVVRSKLEYIADDAFRTLTAEITRLILLDIADYENEYGPIKVPEEE
ncbi:hypothetical protein FACS1894184_17100 [Clostridia bacterium]|nr:hypothetical protein FACS1894184_17100 [Clostridia bacterium]